MAAGTVERHSFSYAFSFSFFKTYLSCVEQDAEKSASSNEQFSN